MFIRRAASDSSSLRSNIWASRDVSFESTRRDSASSAATGREEHAVEDSLAYHRADTGRAELYGRVGSLLEVGTGFDRELTGRENMYLNGAILGMTKREIDRKAR